MSNGRVPAEKQTNLPAALRVQKLVSFGRQKKQHKNRNPLPMSRLIHLGLGVFTHPHIIVMTTKQSDLVLGLGYLITKVACCLGSRFVVGDPASRFFITRRHNGNYIPCPHVVSESSEEGALQHAGEVKLHSILGSCTRPVGGQQWSPITCATSESRREFGRPNLTASQYRAGRRSLGRRR